MRKNEMEKRLELIVAYFQALPYLKHVRMKRSKYFYFGVSFASEKIQGYVEHGFIHD